MRRRLLIGLGSGCWRCHLSRIPGHNVNYGFVRCTGTGVSYSTSSLQKASSFKPRPKGFFESLFEKPNITARSRIPLSEEELVNLGKRELLYTAQYYHRFRYENVTELFEPDSQFIQDLTDVEYDLSKIDLNAAIPNIGSLVESQSPTGEINFGVVVKPLAGKFEEHLNSIEIFTADGKFINIRPSEITFHIPSFYKKRCIVEALNAINSTPLLQQVQYSTILFLHYCIDIHHELQRNGFTKSVYLMLSSNSVMRSFTLDRALDKLEQARSILPQRRHLNFALLFALHFHAANSPDQFLLHKPHLNLKSNNNLISPVSYFAIPRFTSETVHKVSTLNSQQIKEFHEFVAYMKKDSELTHRIGSNVVALLYYQKNNYYNAHYMIFLFLKYYAKYPHPLLKPTVTKIIGDNFTLQNITDFFYGLHLFDANSTDILLSSQLFGKDPSSLSISEARKILPKDGYDSIRFTRKSPLGQESVYEDHFRHLRTDMTADRSDIAVFGFPTDETGSHSELCFSIVKKNSRDWIINFHVPDVGSSISPRSNDGIFAKILKRPFAQDLTLPNGELTYLPSAVKRFFAFANGSDTGQNCFTISFQFNVRNPDKSWRDMKPTIKADMIKNVQVLNKAELEYSTGSVGPLSFSGDIRDFDMTDVSELYSVMMARRKYRRNNGALDGNLPQQVLKVQNGKISMTTEQQDSSSLFLDESKLMIDSLMGTFCQNAGLPVYYHTQGFVTHDLKENDADSSFINPLSHFLPQSSVKFQDLLYQRSFSGTLTPTAYFCALEFLDKEKVHHEPPAASVHRYYGTDSSLVKFAEPLRSMEQLVNQWQILKVLHKGSGHGNAQLNLQGYSVADFKTIIKTKRNRTPITIETFHRNGIEEKTKLLQHLAHRSKVQWTIKWLKQLHGIIPRKYQFQVGELAHEQKSNFFPEMTEDPFIFLKCLITRSGSSPNLVWAYSMELGIEAEILLLPGSSVSIGDRLVCTSIVYLNEVEERLILMQ